jgi:cytochrome c
MKKIVLSLSAFAIFLAACGGSSENSTNDTSTTTTTANSTPKKHDGEILILKSDCIGCHQKEEKLIGPSYQEVADKYENNEANVDLLAGKIINGGKGVWGTIAMTPHPKVTADEAKKMVEYIFTLKK